MEEEYDFNKYEFKYKNLEGIEPIYKRQYQAQFDSKDDFADVLLRFNNREDKVK